MNERVDSSRVTNHPGLSRTKGFPKMWELKC